MSKLSAIQNLSVDGFLHVAGALDSQADVRALNAALTRKGFDAKTQARLPLMLSAHTQSFRDQLRAILPEKNQRTAFDGDYLRRSLQARSMGITLQPPLCLAEPGAKAATAHVEKRGIGILAFANVADEHLTELLAQQVRAKPMSIRPWRHSYVAARQAGVIDNTAGLHPLQSFAGALLHEDLLRWCARAPTYTEHKDRQAAKATILRAFADMQRRALEPSDAPVWLTLTGQLTTLPASLCLITDLQQLSLFSEKLCALPEALAWLPSLGTVGMHPSAPARGNEQHVPVQAQGLRSSAAQRAHLLNKLCTIDLNTRAIVPLPRDAQAILQALPTHTSPQTNLIVQTLQGVAAAAEQVLLQMRYTSETSTNALQPEAAALAQDPDSFAQFGLPLPLGRPSATGRKAFVENLRGQVTVHLPYADPLLGIVYPAEAQQNHYQQRAHATLTLQALNIHDGAANVPVLALSFPQIAAALLQTLFTALAAARGRAIAQPPQLQLTALLRSEAIVLAATSAASLALLIGTAAYGLAGLGAIAALRSACFGASISLIICYDAAFVAWLVLRLRQCVRRTYGSALVPLPEFGRNIAAQIRSLQPQHYRHLPAAAKTTYILTQTYKLLFATAEEAAHTTLVTAFTLFNTRRALDYLVATNCGPTLALLAHPVSAGVLLGLLLVQPLYFAWQASRAYRAPRGPAFAQTDIDISGEAARSAVAQKLIHGCYAMARAL